jgi:hypothetical protein
MAGQFYYKMADQFYYKMADQSYYKMAGQGSSIGIANHHSVAGCVIELRMWQEIFSSVSSLHTLPATHPASVQRVLFVLQGIKRSARGVDHSLIPLITDVNNEWSYTSNPHISLYYMLGKPLPLTL